MIFFITSHLAATVQLPPPSTGRGTASSLHTQHPLSAVPTAPVPPLPTATGSHCGSARTRVLPLPQPWAAGCESLFAERGVSREARATSYSHTTLQGSLAAQDFSRSLTRSFHMLVPPKKYVLSDLEEFPGSCHASFFPFINQS